MHISTPGFLYCYVLLYVTCLSCMQRKCVAGWYLMKALILWRQVNPSITYKYSVRTLQRTWCQQTYLWECNNRTPSNKCILNTHMIGLYIQGTNGLAITYRVQVCLLRSSQPSIHRSRLFLERRTQQFHFCTVCMPPQTHTRQSG